MSKATSCYQRYFSNMRTVLLIFSIYISSVTSAPCQPNTLVITTQPGDGFGGDPLTRQPVLMQLTLQICHALMTARPKCI